jgi:hypothetical protein
MKVRFSSAFLVIIPFLILSSCFTGMVNTRMNRVYDQKRADAGPFSKTEDNNGEFPEAIYIKTSTQTFSDTYYFLLSDGRIWYKSIDPSGDVPAWTIFRSTGLPSARFKKGFIKPHSISSISADANELQAISDKGRIYQYVFDPGLLLQDYFWKDHIGWPEAAPLEINDLVRGFRAWAVGKRNASVLWSEDRFGNQHHYGTMGIENSYFLCANGQDIRYSDTGLPSDFSHALLGPERGRFIAESLSASACTLFVINAAGEMYTRQADFDTLGCDPLFRYTYRARDYGIPGSSYRSNYTPWGLPALDWKKEPSITLAGAARLTRHITILRTGQGNDGRELRVAGTDPAGRIGYYHKGIADSAWTFREAPLSLSDADFLDRETVAKGTCPRGPSAERPYFGSLWKASLPVDGVFLEIPNFSLSEGSCALVASRKGEKASLTMHPVDAWTYLRRYDPGRDGTPKLMMVTIEIPDGSLDGLTPEFRAILSDLFGKNDRETFAYIAEATTDYILIRQSKPTNGDIALFFSTDPDAISINPSVFRRIALGNDEFIRDFTSQDLKLDSAKLSGSATANELTALIEHNKEFKKKLEASIKMYSSYKLSSSISGKTYSVFNAFSHVTLIYLIDFPKIYTVTRQGTPIMRETARNAAAITDAKYWMYKKVLELVDIRIELYSALLAAVKGGLPPPERVATFSEDFQGYFAHTGIPETVSGVWHDGGEPVACVSTAELLESDLPGLLVVTRESAPRVYLIDFKNLPEDVYRRDGLDFSAKPLKTAVDVSPLIIPGIPVSDFMASEASSVPAQNGETAATLEWDGTVLKIWAEDASGRRTVLFDSTEG